MSEQDLRNVFDCLAERVSSKVLELKVCKAELAGAVGRLVDAPEKERQALISRRAELVNLRDVLSDELELLSSRKDSAYLAIFEYEQLLAETKMQKLAGISTARRKELEAAIEALRRGGGRSGRVAENEESIRQLAALELKKVKAQTESQVAYRDVERAKRDFEHAREATEQARRAVGIKQPV